MDLKPLCLAVTLAASPAVAMDYSVIDCADKEFLTVMVEEINNLPAVKAVGSIVDITEAATIPGAPGTVTCRATLTTSDLTTARMIFSIHDNSLGQPVLLLKPDRQRGKGRR